MTKDENWPSRTRKWNCPEGQVYWRVSEKDGKPYFVEGHVGKAGGGAVYAAINAIGALAGRALRTGTSPRKLIIFLKGIAVCSLDDIARGEFDAQSVPDALARTLEEFYP